MTILSNTLADRELNTSDNTRWPSPHHNFVPEYQQSGIPFAKEVTLTAANPKAQVLFPSVTRWITITSVSGCYINFNDDLDLFDDNTKAFYVPANTATRFELKCKALNIKEGAGNLDNDPIVNQYVYILAGLTNVPPKNFPNQTADNGFAVEPEV